MKHKLLHFKSILCSLGILLLLIGCQNDEGNHTHNEELRVKRINLSEIPAIQNAVELKSQNTKDNSGLENYLAHIITEDVTAYTNGEGLSTYTFGLDIEEPEGQLTNLVVAETGDGLDYYTITYRSENIEAWKEDIRNNRNPGFEVSIEAELLSGTTNKAMTTCFTEVGTYTCPSGEHNLMSPNRDACIYAFSKWIIGVTVMSAPCDQGGGPGGGQVSGPIVSVPNAPVNMLANFVSGLSTAQKAWWYNVQNAGAVSIIKNYLNTNAYMASTNAFVIQFIQANIDTGLNLDFNKSAKSPMNIDITSVSGNSPEEIKFKRVYEILNTSVKFRNLFTTMFSATNFINVKFSLTDDIIQHSGHGRVAGDCRLTRYSNGHLFNTIRLDKQSLRESTDLEIAVIILHECVHAYLNIKYRHPTIGMDIEGLPDMSLSECINTYYNGFTPGQNQHNFFINYMIPTMASTLNDIKSNVLTPQQIASVENPSPNSYIYAATPTIPSVKDYSTVIQWNWNNYFTHISYNGLQECSQYQYIYPAGSQNLLNWTQYYNIGVTNFN